MNYCERAQVLIDERNSQLEPIEVEYDKIRRDAFAKAGIPENPDPLEYGSAVTKAMFPVIDYWVKATTPIYEEHDLRFKALIKEFTPS